MTSDEDNDVIDDALFDMGSFDAQDAAIEAAELDGVSAELPEISDAKFEALVAASLDVADLPPNLEERGGPARAWTRWAVAAGGAIAAALLLWQLRSPTDAVSTADAALVAELRLGGTARTLGDAPTVRPYGPGDAFMLELAFETEPPGELGAVVVARDEFGASVDLALDLRRSAASLVLEGEIADMLTPGVWTLVVRYGVLDHCDRGASAQCRRLETKIEVLGE